MRTHEATRRSRVAPLTGGAGRTGPAPAPAARALIRQALHAPRLQRKLTVGAPDDAFEHEADAIADRVMRMPEQEVGVASAPPRVQRLCAECEEEMEGQGTVQRMCAECEEEMQAKEEPGHTPEVPSGFAQRFAALHGQPLPASERAFFEPRFGRDFADVRLHSGPAASDLARSVQARAFTLGNSVVFGAGQYAPGSSSGRQLLAHELTHVVQQGGAGKAPASPLSGSAPVLLSRAPNPYLARACSPTKVSVTDTGKGAQNMPLGSVLSSSEVRYRYNLRWDVTGNIQDCDLGTRISALMEDWSSSKVDYYINAKKSVKADYDDATKAWTENKEKFVDDYTKEKLVGVQAPHFITESGTTWARVADGPGGPVASWATGALVRYTVIAWIKGSDGKELSLRFWVTLWATRSKTGDPFTVSYVHAEHVPGSVTA
jgi:hypothetical protein